MTNPDVLPIDHYFSNFCQMIGQSDLVVEADTGSGKSTRLPIWAAGIYRRVLIVEPRRVACVALADYLRSASQQVQHGLQVDYAIRFDNRVSAATQVAFVTPGIALNWFSEDQLAQFDLVMIDEFHERRWDTDLLLSLLKRGGCHRLLLTSATLTTAPLLAYLGANSQLLQATGRRFTVEISYLASQSNSLPDGHLLSQRVFQAITLAVKQHDCGDILVFLPGKAELASCASILQPLGIPCLQLHGGTDVTLQRQVLAVSSVRRIILATNVAETSLTIPGVTVVIDSGLERRTLQRNGRTVLSLQRISKAAAAQRCGRAGRLQAGHCYRLWGEFAPLDAVTPAQLQREELVDAMLAAAAAGSVFSQLAFIEPLPEKSLQSAKQKLLQIGAIQSDGTVTDLGRRIFPLPIDTQFSYLITAMQDECSQGMMVDICAALSIGRRLWQLPTSPEGQAALLQWQALPCDASMLLAIVRMDIPDFLHVDMALRQEVQQLANQIRTAVGLAPFTATMPEQSQRLCWLKQLVTAMPELAFMQRHSRVNAYGNEISEVQISRDSRFALLPTGHAKPPSAALVLDQFSLPGKGLRQTLNMATCMVPVPLSLLFDAGLGRDQLSEQRDSDGHHLFERIYAGHVLGLYCGELSPEQAFAETVTAILKGNCMAGVAAAIQEDLAAWQLWRALTPKERQQLLGGVDEPQPGAVFPTDAAEYLRQKLTLLGVEGIEDLALLEPSDLQVCGIPDWCRAEFDDLYPRALILAELQLHVEYDVRRRLVSLIYHTGVRKADPKRWELPKWQGWRIEYRRASRVVQVK